MGLTEALAVTTPAFACAGAAFVFILFLYTKIWGYKTGKDIGEPLIDELSLQIKSGASSFLTTEYSYLTVFVLALAATLFGLFFMTAESQPMLTATAVAS